MRRDSKMQVRLMWALIILGGFAFGAILRLTQSQVASVPTTANVQEHRVNDTTISQRSHSQSVPLQTQNVASVPSTPIPRVALRTDAATSTPAVTQPGGVAPVLNGGEVSIDEANVAVGHILWVGALRRHGTTLSIAVRKASVGGRSASPCERSTTLQATFDSRQLPQTVPYTESNCQGQISGGTMMIASLDGSSFSGRFEQAGKTLGPYRASISGQ